MDVTIRHAAGLWVRVGVRVGQVNKFYGHIYHMIGLPNMIDPVC